MKKLITIGIFLMAPLLMQAQLSGYRITGARVSIKTGNDNKENPSRVQVYLFPTFKQTYTQLQAFAQLNLSNEMKVNSTTEIGLTPFTRKKVPWPVQQSQKIPTPKDETFISGSNNWLLEDLQRQGFRLLVVYRPNYNLDAWKIDRVTVKLEIKKADGSPHPSLNNKAITFTVQSPALGFPTGLALVCEADKELKPATHYLSKDILIER